MKKIAVSLSIGTMDLKPQVDEIFRVLGRCNVSAYVVLTGHTVLDPQGSAWAEAIAHQYPTRVFTALADSGTWAAGYLKGMQIAIALGVDAVISMDADGSHDPAELEKFVRALETRKAVMSSRFIASAVNRYPLQRRVISFVGTVLTRLFLTTYRLTDFTSGFEAVDAQVLASVFARYSPEEWVAVRVGPYHLQNTELRLALIDFGCDIVEIPIVYGVRRVGKTFDLDFLFKVFLGFVSLVRNRSYMRKVLSAKKGTQF